MDLIRGGAILLVVLLHATAIPWMFAGITSGHVVNDINSFFAPYRMSLLFLLAGVLLTRSLAKPPGTYYWNKVRTLIWPYLVWMVIGMLTEGYTDLRDPFFWIPNNWLWFIFFLAAYYAVAPLLARIPGTWFAVVPAALWVASWPIPDGDFSNLCYYGGFFFAGHLVARYRGALARIESWPLLIGCTALAAGFGALLIGQTHGTYFGLDGALRWVSNATATAPGDGSVTAATRIIDRYELVWIPVVLAGVAAVMMITRRLAGVRRGGDGDSARWLQYIGRNSVVFYVVHYPAQIMITSWMGDWGILDPTWLLIINTAVAMGLSYLFCWLRRWPAGDALFVFPKLRRAKRS